MEFIFQNKPQRFTQAVRDKIESGELLTRSALLERGYTAEFLEDHPGTLYLHPRGSMELWELETVNSWNK